MAQTNLVTRVQQEVARAFSFLAGETRPQNQPASIILAVSGGADSLCLADAAIAIAATNLFQPVIFHFNHQLRGANSDADAAFVVDFAAAQGVTAYCFTHDIAAAAQAQATSVEVAGRHARYAQLAALAAEIGATTIATAHHADDQAETVLMRLLRGTGLSGLRGMRQHDQLPIPHSPVVLVRPLLRFTRAQIEHYCADRGLHPRLDASNADVAHTRNRIRHELLPALEHYNPNIRAVLARLADSAASEFEVVQYATQQAMQQVAQPINAHTIVFDRAAWQALPEGLQRATLREAVHQIKGHLTDLKYAAIEEARDVLTSPAHTGEIALQADVRIAVEARAFRVGVLSSQ